MTEPVQTPPPSNGSESTPAPAPETNPPGPLYAPESGFSLFVKLFIVPAAIVAVALGIFLLGTFSLQHPKTATQYLQELRSDSTEKRWQSAYELSRMLAQGETIQFDDNLKAQLVEAFTAGKKDDPRLRQYLALVLGHLKVASAVPALVDGVSDDSQDVKIYSLWALGNIGDPAGGQAALSALEVSDPAVQCMAAGALGSMRYEPAKFPLEKNLESTNDDLRFDSAVALSRLKDPQAVPVLMEMLTLKPTGNPEKDLVIPSAKMAAIEGALELKDVKLLEQITVMSKKDPDLKVRDAAIQALKK